MRVNRVSLFRKYPAFTSIHTELRQIALGKPCAYCGKILNKSNLTIDHLLAKSLGGKSNINNYVACCNPCNQAKGCKTLWQFIKSQPRGVIHSIKAYLSSLNNRKIDGVIYSKKMRDRLWDEFGISK